MVSFDVVCLFTKVPLKQALEHISHLLCSDDTLEERTGIPAEAVCKLRELCPRATYFNFEEQFYKQVDGAAIGSPLSPIVANLYTLEGFESKAFASAPSTPTMRLRYVGNTFIIWPHDTQQLKDFHPHLNKQHHQIHFIRKYKNENQISFLDMSLKREDGVFGTHEAYPHRQVHPLHKYITPPPASEIWNH